MQEEYKLLNSNNVLPEFLVQYRFKGKDVAVGGAEEAAGGYDIDLSRGEVHLPKFDHKREAKGDMGQFPMGRVTTAGPAEAGRRGAEGNKATSASYTDNNEWATQRENSAKQKAMVIAQTEKLFKQCQQSFNEIKIKNTFQPKKVVEDDGEEG